MAPKSRTPRRSTRLSVEVLEDRLAPSAGLPPDIVVGRTQSAYSTLAVPTGRLDVTYTVYNQRAEDVTGVLLTTTLQSGVTFTTASQLPDRSGQQLAWGLGTIPALGRASVTLTVTLPAIIPTQIDSGAKAFATLNAAEVTADTPAAALVARALPADALASTPDANTTDPFVQEQAAKLRYDPQAIFTYLNEDVGYESYAGSLRGARGTLWSVAGNSLDEASLGVALFRASGIPARYARGTLSDPLARQLILTMFPPGFQTVGYIPAGTATADPANDPQLLAETRDHYWLQVDTGGGFQSADTSGMGGTAIGAAYTAVTQTFTVVADALRHKVRVSLDAEIYNSASALFGFGGGLGSSTVLDRTFNAVELVGKPLTVGNFVSQSALGALVFSSRTTTYTPYLVVGDEAADPLDTDLSTGTAYQEVLTNFPFGTQVLTGLVLSLTLTGPDGPAETHTRALYDRIGPAARLGSVAVNVSAAPNGPPALTDLDMWTVLASPTAGNPRPSAALPARLTALGRTLDGQRQADGTLPASSSPLLREYLREFSLTNGRNMESISRLSTQQLAHLTGVKAYYDRPRLTLYSSNFLPGAAGGAGALAFKIDLRRNTIRAVAAPGQNPLAGLAFNATRGLQDSELEHAVLAPLAGVGPSVLVSSAAVVIQEALRQGVPFVAVTGANLAALDGLAISADTKARITASVQDGFRVLVPSRAVSVGGTTTTAWYRVTEATGETIAVSEDGGHSGAVVAWVAVIAVATYIVGSISGGFILAGIQLGDVSLHTQGNLFFKLGIANAINNNNNNMARSAFPIAFGLANGLLTSVLFLAKLADPPAPPFLVDLGGPVLRDDTTATTRITTPAALPAGTVSGTATANHLTVTGPVAASWQSAGTSAFHASALDAASATVTDASGTVVGSGHVTFAATDTAPVAVTGSAAFAVNGTGTLAFYGAAGSTLGVAGEWDSYTGTVTGGVLIALTSNGLKLDGVALPAGTYTVTTSAATLAGRGRSSSPAFAGSAQLTVTGGTVVVGPGGTAQSGTTFSGYTGQVTVTGNATDTDSATFQGTATSALRLDVPATITANQNAPVDFSAAVRSSASGSFDLTAEVPDGWTVAVSDAGIVTVRPAPGTQSGTWTVRLTARSVGTPALVTAAEVTVTVTATAPGLELTAGRDPLLTVTYSGAELPTAFRATLRNVGPAADTFTVSAAGLPAGFTLASSGTTVTVPAGRTGMLGLYLQPVAGSALPAPGTVLMFDVTATSTTNPAITRTVTVTFVMTAVHAVTLTATPAALNTTPGQAVTGTLTLRAAGNVAETVALTATPSAGLTLTGLPPTITLTPGQTVNLSYSVTPSGTTPLNSTLLVTFATNLGPTAADEADARLPITVRVVVPGADAIATASTAAAELGDIDLSNRLGDLSVALTNLVQTPTSAVFRSQALAAIDSIVTLLRVDPSLVSFADPLAAARTGLANAVTPTQIQTAVVALGGVLEDFAETVSALRHHNVEVYLIPNQLVAQPGVAQQFGILLRNIGDQTTTYDLTLLGLPAGVTGNFSQSSVTLAAGQFSTGLFATLTQTSTTELQVFEFQVRATAAGFPTVTRSAPGTMQARAETVSVVSVTATPPFANAGGTIAVSTRVLNAVNRQQDALASFEVRDPNGTVVFTSTPVPFTLSVVTSLVTVDLGTFDTTGFANGEYAIIVTIADAGGTPIIGAIKDGRVLIGSPVTGSIAAGPQTLPPGTNTVTNTLVVETRRTNLIDPFSVVSLTDLPGAAGVAKYGHYVYASGTTGIRVFDIADPSNPQLIRTFGENATTLEIRGDKLFALHWSGASGRFPLTIYSLTDPENPQFLGRAKFNNQDGIPYSLAWNMVVTDTHVFVSTWSNTSLIGPPHDIKFQTGDVIAIDVSDPTAPVFVSALLNTYGTNSDGIGQFLNIDNNGGDGNLWEIVQLDANTLLVAGSTAKGDNTQAGSGVVHVIDISDPAHMAIVRTLAIPGTVQAVGLSVAGNRAFVAASQGGWSDPANPNEFTGNLVLATLDVSNPRNPVLIHSEVLDRSSVGPYSLRTTALGNGLFAFSSQGTTLEQPALIVVDASNPAVLVTGRETIPAITSNLDGAGNFVYATSPSGLIIYQLPALPSVSVSAQVQIPKGTGVAVVPGSFNIAPTSIVPGADFDTLVWDITLDEATPTRTFTWQSTVTDLQPGESRELTLGTAINFTTQGTPGLVTFPATSVVAEQILSLDPAARTVQPGEQAGYTLTVANPSTVAVTYTLTLRGVPQSWTDLPMQVTVPAGGSVMVPFVVRSDPFAPILEYGFTVTATAGGTQGSVEATLVLSGPPFVAPAQPQARGVVVELTPQSATAGQGTAAVYRVRVTNTGSETETFALSLTGLPGGVTASFALASISVPPGANNYREVILTLTAGVGTTPGAIPFTVVASATTTAQVGGTLTVVGQGVGVQLDRTAGAPGESFAVTVTNTGGTTDTFDLTVAGPAALVVALGASSVTLAPGQSQVVTLTTGAAHFAAQGGLGFTVVATSGSAPAVRATAAAQLTVPATAGLTAAFDPDTKFVAVPSTTDFLLIVRNTGNTEDTYSATITGTTGAFAAVLVGADGVATQSISTFRLPGLSSATILVRLTAPSAGRGTVTVQIRSLNDQSRTATATATLTVALPTLPTAAAQGVTTDAGTAVTITLGGTDPNSPALPLTFTIITGPAHGTLGPVVGNAVTYTPTAGYVGPDEFTFTTTNGITTSPPAAVAVTVRPPRPVLLGYHEFGVGAGAGHPAVARFFNPDGTERFARTVFPGLSGGVRVTSADFNGDGVADLVAGTGPGSITRVVVLDGVSGTELFAVQPFEDQFVGGVFVAAGDITGDGVPDLVITPDESGGPRVRVFSGAGFGQLADFFGIDDPAFRGGARAAVGDVNGDGFGDLVVSAGFGGGPRVSVIDGRSLTQGSPRRLVADFFLFEEALRNGAFVAAGDVDGDGFADVIGGGGPGGGPRVLGLSGQDLLRLPPDQAAVVANFFGGNADNRGGIRVAARDLDGDRRADLVVGDGTGAGSRVTGYLGKSVAASGTPAEQFALDAYPGFSGGVFVG